MKLTLDKGYPLLETMKSENRPLAHNLTKYQYFSMKASLFDTYYEITYSLQFPVQYHVNC